MATRSRKKRGLTVKQKKLAKFFAATGNQTKAAKLAGYSKKSAHVIGHEMLKKPEIKRAVHEALEESLAKAQLKSDHVIEQLRRIAFSDHADFYHADGRLMHPHEMPEHSRPAVQSVEIDEIKIGGGIKIGETKKLKTLDRTKALELLGKHFKLFTDVSESKVTATVAVVDKEEAKRIMDELEREC